MWFAVARLGIPSPLKSAETNTRGLTTSYPELLIKER
jgi:hypothetical protein